MRLSITTTKIEELANRSGLEVEFDPVGPTVVTADERLIVWAPAYPYVGVLALKSATEAVEAHIQQTQAS